MRSPLKRDAMEDRKTPASIPPFPPEYRASGLLLHATSLPSPYGIGDIGPGAFAWVDRLHELAKGGGRRCRSGPRGMAIRRIHACPRSLATGC